VVMPVCDTIRRVILGELAAVDAYRGLRRQSAGHEADPG
jgi:hypothetical protein